MFKRIYYDAHKNKIFLWENKDGKTVKVETHPEHEFYVKDKTGESGITDIFGNSVKSQKAESLKGMREIAKVMETCEADVPGDMKFLQKRYAGMDLKADVSDFNVCTIDIEVGAKGEFPKAEEAKYPIILISAHYSKTGKMYTFGTQPYNGDNPMVENYHYCADEALMIDRFLTHFRKQRVDILTGWYVRLFDVPYIKRRCEVLGIEKTLSPLNVYKEKSGNAGYHIEGGGYHVAGLSILDGLDLYKNFVYDKRESYSLQSIGMFEVQEGKKDYEGTINDAWEKNWDEFVEYNVQDVLLVMKIEAKKKFIDLTIEFCYQALIPFEKIFSSVSLVTGYVMKFLHDQKKVFPDMARSSEHEHYPGGYVYALPGFFKWCISYDVESEYPHMIMMYNISPETLVLWPDDTTDLIKTPISKSHGVYYRKDKVGVLNEIVSKIFNERKYLKSKGKVAKGLERGNDVESISSSTGIPLDLVKTMKAEIHEEGLSSAYYNTHQMIRKILINSIYGVLANRFFAFYNINNATAITLGGQDLIKYLSNCTNNYFKDNWHLTYKKFFPEYADREVKPLKNDVVILIDTDSNYICFDEIIQGLGLVFQNDEEYRLWAIRFDEVFFKPFLDKILNIYAKKFGVEQVINFKREKIITQKFTLAKKKYADEVIDNEGEIYEEPKVSITGIEIVRTDTPQFCRTRIQTVVNKIFQTKAKSKDAILDAMRKIHSAFLKADVSEIAIPKGVTEYTKYAGPVEEYLKNGLVYQKHCPIHVRASMNYNYIIAKHNLPLQPIYNGTKLRYIHVSPHSNELHQNVIGFVGQWPKEFDAMFTVDYEAQWQRAFQGIIQRFFDVLDWSVINLEQNTLSQMMEF